MGYQGRATLIIWAMLMGGACGPKVTSFRASPCTTITREDSIRFIWRVRGETQIVFHVEDAGDDENPQKRYLMYKLVARKGGKEAASPNLGITLVPDTVVDYVIIDTKRVRDSAIAVDTKDTLVWGTHFLLDRVSSLSHRPMSIAHGGQTVVLDGSGTTSMDFRGLPNSGRWRMGILLTDAEKRDTTLIPAKLQVRTVVVHTKQ